MRLNFNGQVISIEKTPFLSFLTANNRAFSYNDSVFETMRVRDGRILWLAEHAARLAASLAILHLDLATEAQRLADFLQQEVTKTLENTPNARVRLTVFRADGGFYTPLSDTAQFLLTYTPLATAAYEPQEKGGVVGVAEQIKLPVFAKNCLPLQTLKNTLAPWYIAANRERNEKGYDEIILLNAKNEAVDGGSSAFFIVKNGQIIAPKNQNQAIKSVMQTVLFEQARQIGISIRYKKINRTDLQTADELLFCNVIKGLCFAQKIELNGVTYCYKQQAIYTQLRDSLLEKAMF